MFSLLRYSWRRHKKKVIYTTAILGSGYLLYKLYDVHRRRLYDMQRELSIQRENDEFIKIQMRNHFEKIQKIADTITLPHAIHYLSDRVADKLDLYDLTERLMKGKGQIGTSEKLKLWDELKILSFTRIVVSLWAMVLLSLYIKVQVNILGRHLYIDAARGLGNSNPIESTNFIDSHDQQKFLATSDFLANNSLSDLISDVKDAATQVLMGKQLRDLFNITVLNETVMQIVSMFISMKSPYYWMSYLIHEDTTHHETTSGGETKLLCDMTIFDQFMKEMRAVLLSAEFENVVEISLRNLVGALTKDIDTQFGSGLLWNMPLAKLLPRIAHIGPLLLQEPSKNQFIKILGNLPEAESLFTLVYSTMPTQ